MRYLILIVSLITMFTLYGTKSENNYNEPYPNTRHLDSLKNINNKPFLKDSIIVIYTFIGCKPCQALAKNIKKKFNYQEYWKRIVFVNDIDYDETQIKNYLTSDFPFAYLKTKVRQGNGTYPLICFYGKDGNYLKKIEGYGPGVLNKIARFLKR